MNGQLSVVIGQPSSRSTAAVPDRGWMIRSLGQVSWVGALSATSRFWNGLTQYRTGGAAHLPGNGVGTGSECRTPLLSG